MWIFICGLYVFWLWPAQPKTLEQFHKILSGTLIKLLNRKKEVKGNSSPFSPFLLSHNVNLLVTPCDPWLWRHDVKSRRVFFVFFFPLWPPYQSTITKVIFFFLLQRQLNTQCAALRCRRPAACTQSATCWGIPGELLVFYPAKSISWGVKDATSTQT